MTPFLAQISERLDWFGYGISSVNRTGAFVASMSLACLVLTCIRGKFWFYMGVVGSLMFAYFMILTMSRGAFVAWLCGMTFFMCFSVKNQNKQKLVMLAGLLSIVFIFSIYAGVAGRFQPLSDSGKIKTDIRSDLYIAGLKMLSDAPGGWNEAPQKIYKTWYQDLDKSENPMSLINSHLQFMTQHGVFVRIIYMFIWAFALLLAFPRNKNQFNAVACSVFICTFVSAIFSNVLNYWIVWIPFVALLAYALWLNRSRLKIAKFWVACFGLSVCSYGALHAVSYALPRDTKIFKHGDEIIVGNDELYAFILMPTNALGDAYGRELVEFMKNKNFSVLLSPIPTPEKFPLAIVSSDFDTSIISKINTDKIVILNAMSINADFDEANALKAEVIVGDMSNWRRKRYWESVAGKNPNIKLTILSGVGDYIPDWTKLIDGIFDLQEECE